MPFCTQCGKPVNSTAKFCGVCGEPNSASQLPLAPTIRQESVPEYTPQDATRAAKCPFCQGTRFANGKCVGCGAREEWTKTFQGAGAGKYMQQADVAAVLQQAQRPPPAQKPCPTCNRPIDYIPQFQKYYCTKCKKYS